MLTGKQKARMLLSLLGDQTQHVLTQLTKESASLLTASIDDAPEPEPEVLNELLSDILEKIDELKTQKDFELNEEPDEDVSFEITTAEEKEKALAAKKENEKAEQEESIGKKETSAKKEGIDSKDLDPLGSLEPQLVADMLSSASNIQTIAFFLSGLDETIRDPIVELLPNNISSKLDSISIEKTPISKAIFSNLKEHIITSIHNKLAAEEEEEAVKREETLSGFSSSESLYQPELLTTDEEEENKETTKIEPIGGFEESQEESIEESMADSEAVPELSKGKTTKEAPTTEASDEPVDIVKSAFTNIESENKVASSSDNESSMGFI